MFTISWFCSKPNKTISVPTNKQNNSHRFWKCTRNLQPEKLFHISLGVQNNNVCTTVLQCLYNITPISQWMFALRRILNNNTISVVIETNSKRVIIFIYSNRWTVTVSILFYTHIYNIHSYKKLWKSNNICIEAIK